MSDRNTKFWLIPEFNNLELFRANAIHYQYARHSHSGYSIGVIEAGVGGNHYRGTTYLAPPQSIILMNPDEAHTGYSAEEMPLTYRMLYPNVELIEQIAIDLQIKRLPYFTGAVVENKTLAQSILSLHTALEKSIDRIEKQTRLIEVFSAVLLHYGDAEIRSISSKKEHDAVRLVKEYLHDHFSSQVSLEQLSEITNLDRSYLIRIFRQAVGMPPYTYLNQIRVEKAKQFLRQGMAVADVAIAVGLSDQSHLNRHFKRISGITPGHYRTMSMSSKSSKSISFKTNLH